MAALSPPAQLGAAAAYARRTAVIRQALGDSAVRAYDEIDDYSDINRFLDSVVPLSIAAQRALASVLAGYLVTVSGERGAVSLDLDSVSGDATRPEGMRDSWSIPTWSMFAALGAGVVFADAFAQARRDVETKAMTDLAFTQSMAIAQLSEDVAGLYGYRRILMGEGCEFCALASDQVYNVGELLPLHPGCNCAVAPLMLTERGVIDPADTMNQETLSGAEGNP